MDAMRNVVLGLGISLDGYIARLAGCGKTPKGVAEITEEDGKCRMPKSVDRTPPRGLRLLLLVSGRPHSFRRELAR